MPKIVPKKAPPVFNRRRHRVFIFIFQQQPTTTTTSRRPSQLGPCATASCLVTTIADSLLRAAARPWLFRLERKTTGTFLIYGQPRDRVCCDEGCCLLPSVCRPFRVEPVVVPATEFVAELKRAYWPGLGGLGSYVDLYCKARYRDRGRRFFSLLRLQPQPATLSLAVVAATTLVSFRSEFVAEPKPAFGYGLGACGTRSISGAKTANKIDGVACEMIRSHFCRLNQHNNSYIGEGVVMFLVLVFFCVCAGYSRYGRYMILDGWPPQTKHRCSQPIFLQVVNYILSQEKFLQVSKISFFGYNIKDFGA